MWITRDHALRLFLMCLNRERGLRDLNLRPCLCLPWMWGPPNVMVWLQQPHPAAAFPPTYTCLTCWESTLTKGRALMTAWSMASSSSPSAFYCCSSAPACVYVSSYTGALSYSIIPAVPSSTAAPRPANKDPRTRAKRKICLCIFSIIMVL